MTIPAQGDRIEPAGLGLARRAKLLSAAAAASLALATALTTGFVLPRHAFVASAIVGIEGGQAALRPALAQAAADAAVSRQVVARASSSGSAPADILSRAVRAEIGHVPGSLMVRAEDADAERAAAMATSVATALVADLEDRAQEASRVGDAAAALRLARLQDTAVTVHRRLAELGGDTVDPAATGAAAAARIAALRTRLDAIHAILAAGNPPLGTGRDLPTNIDALQTSYLDLTRQLARASETLGERHTTVIGLRDGIKRTAAELTDAWTRLAKATEADLAEAKSRAATAIRGGARDASRIATVDAARAAAQAADEAVTRAPGVAHEDDLAHYRLIARAPVPALANGLAPSLHLAAATLAGLVMLLISRRVLRPKPSPAGDVAFAEVAPELVLAAPHVIEARSEPHRFFEEDVAEPEHGPDLAPRPEPVGRRASAPRAEGADTNASREEFLRAALHARTVMDLRKPVAPRADTKRRDSNYDLVVTMARVLPSIAAIVPHDEIPVVLVATNEPGASTMDAVLALGEAAAATGQRVLIVEGAKARPALAASVDESAEPALIEVFGDWRVVLRAEAGEGLLYLAPSFRDGGRLAEELANSRDTLVADALAEEFDLVIIDGDRASEAYALAREADGFLRIGRFASPRDDEHFLTLLGAPRRALLGSVAADVSVFVPSSADRSTPAAEPSKPLAAVLRAASAARPAARAPFVATRKPAGVELRRRAGLR